MPGYHYVTGAQVRRARALRASGETVPAIKAAVGFQGCAWTLWRYVKDVPYTRPLREKPEPPPKRPPGRPRLFCRDEAKRLLKETYPKAVARRLGVSVTAILRAREREGW